MKKLGILLMLLIGTTAFSQDKNARAILEVDGVCNMCKERIEKACIKTKGVKSAVWNVKTHELSLIYDARKTNLHTIETNIAAVGHDTKNVSATDEAYNSVHHCCLYRDDAVINDHKDD
ncbi:MAG: heavy-metal-associated domain-containing protein [Xanthomarina sp.]